MEPTQHVRETWKHNGRQRDMQPSPPVFANQKKNIGQSGKGEWGGEWGGGQRHSLCSANESAVWMRGGNLSKLA